MGHDKTAELDLHLPITTAWTPGDPEQGGSARIWIFLVERGGHLCLGQWNLDLSLNRLQGAVKNRVIT